MNFFTWLMGENTRGETMNETSITSDVLLKAFNGDDTISKEEAMNIPSVNANVDFIASAVACMPVKLYREIDGKVKEVKDDPRTRFLNNDTGDALDAFQMKKALVSDYLMGKGGYIYIRRKRNDVTGLFYVDESNISIMKNADPVFKANQILIEGRTYQSFEFIKLLRNTKDGASGKGLTDEVGKALQTAYRTLLYQLGIVRNGGNKKGFLQAERKLGAEEITALKNAWKNLYSDNNADSIVILNNGLKFQESSETSVEMQLNENKKTLSQEINNIFHIDQSFDNTFKFAIYPVVKAFETALNRDLLLEKEKKRMYFECDVKEIIRASIKDRYEAYKLAKETGFLTINEIRKEENLEWIEGMDVINVGLSAVMYDTNTHLYYVPNTNTVGGTEDGGNSGGKEEESLESNNPQ